MIEKVPLYRYRQYALYVIDSLTFPPPLPLLFNNPFFVVLKILFFQLNNSVRKRYIKDKE